MGPFDWGDLIGAYGLAALPLALVLSGLWWVVRQWQDERQHRIDSAEKVLTALIASNDLHRSTAEVLRQLASHQSLSPGDVARLQVLLERVERLPLERLVDRLELVLGKSKP